jgi:nitroreductase
MSRTAQYPIADQFLCRHSPRAFSAQDISEDQMRQVIEAARWAPSASNNQPWRVAYALRGDAQFGVILGTLAGGNQVWAGAASGLIALASNGFVAREDGPAPNAWAAFDAGTAWGFLALQAHTMGLITHAMGGFDAPALGAALDIPQSYTLHCVIAVGYKGDSADLPEAIRAREVPNGRNAQDTWAAKGRFI